MGVALGNRVKALEKHAERSDDVHKEIMNRLNAKDISDALTRQQLDTLIKTTSRIEGKVDEQQKIPANRWNTIVTTAITGIVGALVGAITGLLL